MTKPLIMGMAIVLMLCSVVSAGSGPAMKEGQWEMTMETEMEGMPMKMPPITINQCITQTDPVPQSQQPGQQCTVKDVITDGNTVTWTVDCNTPGGKSSGKGKVTYENDSMDGTMTISAQGMNIISRFKGRYLGPCQK